MKKAGIFLTFVLAATFVSGQKRYIFKQLGADTSSAIMGVCQYYDDQKTYKRYAFFIDNKADLAKVAQSVYCGDTIKVDTLDDDLEIFIINNKEAMPIQLGISPKYGYFNVENDYYAFDALQLKTLATTYPLNYSAKLMKFTTEATFNGFTAKYKNDPAFLCYEDITEELEGHTIILMKIEGGAKPASAGWSIIEKDLQQTGAKEDKDYIISYSPSAFDTHLYKYKVQLSRKTYEKLSNPAYSKSPWVMNNKEIITYWRK